jgi:hypothetical protein
MLLLQLVNYLQYYDWQWANGVRKILHIGEIAFPVRTFFTILFTGLGLRGLFYHRRTDRAGWWLLFTLFLTTGLVLMLYMNFKPGYFPRVRSLSEDGRSRGSGAGLLLRGELRGVGLWAGMGLGTLVRKLMERRRVPASRWRRHSSLLAAPFAGNFTPLLAVHGPDARLAADFAFDLLNTVPPVWRSFHLRRQRHLPALVGPGGGRVCGGT